MLNTLTVYYDGNCSYCRQTVNKWMKKDKNNLLKFSSFRENIPMEMADYRDNLSEEMHSFDGERVYKGFSTIVEINRRIRPNPFIRFFLYLLKITQIGSLGYKLVAKNRFYISNRTCKDGNCQI